jgi:hypothetical protein
MSDVGSSPERGEVVAFDQIERKAKAVSGLLRQALPADGQVQADLRDVAAALAALDVQLAEWVALHRLIHELLAALAPFRALLASVGESVLGAKERQALLQSWRPCQRCADGLAAFAEEVMCIGRPLCRDGRELAGERWVVDVLALQVLIEDALKEEELDLGNLFELTEELDSACHRHLTMADHGLGAAADRVRRLNTSLLGGLE